MFLYGGSNLFRRRTAPMQESSSTRRDYVKVTGMASVIGLAGMSGCITGNDTKDGSNREEIQGPIQIGSILPITGHMSAHGPGMQKAVELAVDDVNDAGGIRGAEINLTTKDSKTDPEHALREYKSLVSDKSIVGFVGAASSVVSTVLAKSIPDDSVMQVSSASTSPVLSDLGYNPYREKFFARTVPNDGQQGVVMAKIMGDHIKAESASILHIANAYGESLARKVETIFQGETLQVIGYDTKTQDYTSLLDKVHEGDPDAIGLVGYPDNAETILNQWAESDYPTDTTDWVLSEGLNSEEFLTNNNQVVDGMYISTSNPQERPGFNEFKQKIGDVNTPFAPNAYDALILQGLAIERGGEASGLNISQNIRLVSRGEGEKITVNEFKKAIMELRNGNQVNYQGASGPVDLTRKLEPIIPFAIAQAKADGSTKQLETVPRSFFKGKL